MKIKKEPNEGDKTNDRPKRIIEKYLHIWTIMKWSMTELLAALNNFCQESSPIAICNAACELLYIKNLFDVFMLSISYLLLCLKIIK